MALFDFMKKYQKPAIAAPQVSGTAEQDRIDKLLAAKGGKATPTTPAAGGVSLAPVTAAETANAALKQQASQLQVQEAATGAAAANIEAAKKAGEEALAGKERMFQAQQAAEGTMAGEALASQATQARARMAAEEGITTDKINSKYNQALASFATERSVNVADILASFKQSSADLEYRKDVAQLEQIAHVTALNNRKYVDELNAIGQERRLKNDIEFQKEAARIINGGKLDALVDQYNWRAAYNKDERAFAEEMGRMDIEQALAVMNATIQADNQAAVASGAIKTVQAIPDLRDEAAKQKEAAP